MPDRWWERALCAQVGGDIWFPEGQGSSAKDAKEMCRTCPVRRQCLEDALSRPASEDGTGVFGGLSVKERRQLRRERAA